jgi:hypothetical protein
MLLSDVLKRRYFPTIIVSQDHGDMYRPAASSLSSYYRRRDKTSRKSFEIACLCLD